MPRRRSKSTLSVRTFDELCRGVQETLLEGRRRIEWATVLANWETGRLINEHVLLNQDRAGYGEGVIPRLARRSRISERVLYHCAQFNRRFPILNRRSELGWSHYRLLCQIDDDKQRTALTAQAEKHGWTGSELEVRVRQLNLENYSTDGDNPPPLPVPELLVSKRGTPGLYPVIARRGGPALSQVEGLAVDLGFKMYLPLAADDARSRKLTAGSIVRADDRGKLIAAVGATKADLFTYRVISVRVVDGDTLAAEVDLPPYNEIDKKLRLRGIDCSELSSAGGRSAKRFTEAAVEQAERIIIATTKPDKYDRYLADVFLELKSGETIFLNNALLENGHAVQMDGDAPHDWAL